MNRLIYIALIIPALLFAQIEWTEHTIADSVDSPQCIRAVDLDKDGDMDVLTARGGSGFGDITWWESDGSGHPNYTEHNITSTVTPIFSVCAKDLDGDTDIDILGAATSAGTITWWENDGSDPPSFTEHTITNTLITAISVYAEDVDGDDDMDVLCAGGSRVTWWENDGSSPPSFIEHDIANSFTTAYSVYAEDVDGDDDVDVLGAAWTADDITWWENDGADPPSFTEHTIAGDFDGAICVYAKDLDDDDDIDILGAADRDDDITWWENDGADPPSFTEHTIASDFNGAASVYAIDMNDDGDVDVLGTASNVNDIAWWENDGVSPPAFIQHTVADSFSGAISVYAGDLDGDNDVDILGAGFAGDEFAWWQSHLIDIDVGPISIDIPSEVTPDTTFNPQATVKNMGSDSATHIDVICEINPGSYTSMYQILNLLPDDSIQVTFPDAFTFTVGSYTVTVYTELVGDSYSDNDTLEKQIVTTGIAEDIVTPVSFTFGLQNNPVRGKALFNLALPEAALITLNIYDVSGRLIDRLISERKSAGYYHIPWTSETAAGIYLYFFESKEYKKTGKLIFVK